jgi:hypothetical protein
MNEAELAVELIALLREILERLKSIDDNIAAIERRR